MNLLVRTCSTERMNVSRLVARIFIAAGGLVWALMFFSVASPQMYGNLSYTLKDVTSAGVSAIIPLLLTILVFVLAIYFERLAAVVLLVAAAAIIVYGAIAGWSALLLTSAVIALVLPMVVSAGLLLLAASTQQVCELEGKV
jgi:hypothetical protein